MRGILNARHILNQHDLQMPEPMELGRYRKLRVSPLVGDKTLLFYTPALDPRMSMSVARPELHKVTPSIHRILTS